MIKLDWGKTAFAAAVTLALAVGVRDAAAAPGAAADKRPYCRDGAHCNQICQEMYPHIDEPVGICSAGNTCYCYGV
jgi:hypothetical protein